MRLFHNIGLGIKKTLISFIVLNDLKMFVFIAVANKNETEFFWNVIPTYDTIIINFISYVKSSFTFSSCVLDGVWSEQYQRQLIEVGYPS